ncbi:unnamed protein product [Clonostachys rosea]|uniref:Nucleoside phosphorylase domain-containing protein n=1 Tax=Bionectria ochroleuca TaxID=29856 RepID=A0ABY6V0K6_BIOOC|nr:unnamed protein product [Clonostachys rosea]
MSAARAMLDETHRPQESNENDPNSYVLGTILSHNVVIACLPNAEYGTNNAAHVASNLRRTFSGIKYWLMVGIGGADPSRNDIRLGDVVVGTRVMQYDFGKIIKGEIKTSAIPRLPDHSLGTAISNLRSKHEFEPSEIPSILQNNLGKHRQYLHPNLPDRLFQKTYEHEGEAPSCEGCDASRLMPRRERINTPHIHYGAIASSNQVMRDAWMREKVGMELDVIYFEMEAAGVMSVLPCLPIRGICDYADSHKSKEWQRYAAATASAYARELLGILPSRFAQALASKNPAIEPLSGRPEQLLKTLKFEQIESRRMTIKKAHKATCNWLLSHPSYKAWLNPDQLEQHHGVLWISGKPGVGKSTIMKFAHSSMMTSGIYGVIASFFFNARGDILERSVFGMYRSLLIQLLEGYRDLQGVADDPRLLPHSWTGDYCPTLGIIKEILRAAILKLGGRPFTCFIDALDECDEQQAVEMVHYIETLTEDYRNQWLFSVELLQPKIIEKAAGVFLWVALVVKIINEEDRRGRPALQKRLEELPNGLSELFQEILTRDNDNVEELVLSTLWILFANKPLRPDEYYHALWSGLHTKGSVDSDIPTTALYTYDTISRYVTSSSKGLAEITKSKPPTIQFIHESVKDFLLKHNGLNILWPDLGFERECSGHERLRESCEVYLNHHTVRELISKGIRHPDLSCLPLLEYVSKNILLHADAAGKAISQSAFLANLNLPQLTKLLHRFMLLNRFIKETDPSYDPRNYNQKIYPIDREYTMDVSLLYFLADNDYPELINIWLKDHPTTDILGGKFRYPLFAAIGRGNKRSVAALLGTTTYICDSLNMPTPDSILMRGMSGYEWHTPLTWAVKENRTTIIKLLLKRGNAINAKNGRGNTALAEAMLRGNDSVIKLLLENDADPNVIHGYEGETPLTWAVKEKKTELVKLLLDRGAAIETQNSRGQTALTEAAFNGDEATIRVLLRQGADPNATNECGSTPLARAFVGKHDASVRLLLENGAQLDVTT